MKLTSKTFADRGLIPGRCAFAVKAPKGRVRLSDNLNPELSWSAVPEATRSLVLVCTDPDSPTLPDDVNREGREVPLKLPRADFIHWVMVDIPPEVSQIDEGVCSNGVVAGGKKGPKGPPGTRQGLNDYSSWFSGDAEMAGQYLGYDGPCPPWNDSVPHHYRFDLYATRHPRCPVEGLFTAAQVLDAIEGQVLAQASLIGRYSLNPRIRLL